MTTPSEMQSKVDKTVTNMDRLDDFVNGGPTATVTLDGAVAVPSIQKMVAESGLAAGSAEVAVAARDAAVVAKDTAVDAADEAALTLSIIQNLAAGVIYDTTAQGLDPVTGVLDGEFFATWEDGRMRIYLNSGGTAILKVELSTLAQILFQLISTSAGQGASLVKLADGRTVQDVLGLTNGRFYDGTAANLLIRRSTAGPTRVHVEPEGYIDSGVSTKFDYMFDPYALDNINYRLSNWYNSTGDLNGTGESGITFFGAKNVGNHYGLWTSIHFGFSDDGASGCAMKLQYIDTTQPQHYTPAKGGWRAGKVLTAGDYVTSLVGGVGRVYQATTSGTCGATVPSHTTGTVSDGGVSLLFIRPVSGSNVKPIVMFSARDDMPKLGLHNVGVQFARDTAFWNGKKLQFLDSAGVVGWSVFGNGSTDDLHIECADGTARLRLDSTGKFVQINGLAVASVPVSAPALDATPSIKGVRLLEFINASATSVTQFDDGIPWQDFFVTSQNTNTTLVHSSTLRLVGKVNRVLTATDRLYFQTNGAGTVATEIGYRD